MKKVLLTLTALMVLGLSSCSKNEQKIKVSSPSGAPGIALANLAVLSPDDYTYVAAEAISAEFANNEADFIIAPVNAGAKLFKAKKSDYRLAAVITWGNLYFATQKADFALEDIKNSKPVLFGENTINSSCALLALEKNNIKPADVQYLGSAAATQNLLLTDKDAVVLTAEPLLSAALSKNPGIRAWPVNELLKNATGFDGYTQAGLFVRGESVKNNKKAVDAFLRKAEKACAACTKDVRKTAEACAQLKILPNAEIAEKAIPNCAIRFTDALSAKEQVEFTANIDIKQFGGAVPEADFYYEK
jgi:NitT/TauT family transport system substrate-binding protein